MTSLPRVHVRVYTRKKEAFEIPIRRSVSDILGSIDGSAFRSNYFDSGGCKSMF